MNTTYIINVNDKQLREVKALAANRNKTIEEMVAQLFEDGLKDKLYRLRRNAQKYAETKSLKEKVKELEEALMQLPSEKLEEMIEHVEEEV